MASGVVNAAVRRQSIHGFKFAGRNTMIIKVYVYVGVTPNLPRMFGYEIPSQYAKDSDAVLRICNEAVKHEQTMDRNWRSHGRPWHLPLKEGEARVLTNDVLLVRGFMALHRMGVYDVTLVHVEDRIYQTRCELDEKGLLITPWPDQFFDADFHLTFSYGREKS
jgi:hypothetical protein